MLLNTNILRMCKNCVTKQNECWVLFKCCKKTSCENNFNLFCNLFLGSAGFYTLENLQPTTTYDLRFASKNLVGFSEWGAGKQLTMPQRGPPEKPRISTMVNRSLNMFKTYL